MVEPARNPGVTEHVPEREPLAPTIGVWGTSDLDNYGDLLFPLVVEREMSARIPRGRLRFFAPLGHRHPVGFTRVVPSEPLGSWTDERCQELAEQLDGVIVGGGDVVHERDTDYAAWYGIDPREARALAPSRYFIEGLGPRREVTCPVLWNGVGIPYQPDERLARRLAAATRHRPYIAVRDDVSRRRLLDVAPAEAVVVPDPAVLLPRVFPRSDLMQRLDVLRARGWFPDDGPALVVQGHSGLVPDAAPVAEAISKHVRARPGTAVVIVETGPCHGDGSFADALQPRLPVKPHRLPPSVDVSAIAAAIAGSSVFVGSSLHGAITALAYERPFAILGWSGAEKLEAFAETAGVAHSLALTPEGIPGALERSASTPPGESLEALQARLDVHFDRITEIIVESMNGVARERDGHVAAVTGALRTAFAQAAGGEIELAGAVLDQRRDHERQSREIEGQRQKIEGLIRGRHSLEARIAGLSEELRVMRVRLEDLGSRVRDEERTSARVSRVLRETEDSTSYRLGRKLVRTLGRIAPPGSRRRRALLALAPRRSPREGS